MQDLTPPHAERKKELQVGMKSPYKELALRFLPDKIRYLLIGESPPVTPPGESLRYFYNYDNPRNGQILLSTVSYAFMDAKVYVGKNDKKQFLERLAEQGVFLLDATYELLTIDSYRALNRELRI